MDNSRESVPHFAAVCPDSHHGHIVPGLQERVRKYPGIPCSPVTGTIRQKRGKSLVARNHETAGSEMVGSPVWCGTVLIQ